MDVGQAVLLDGQKEALGLFDLHRAMAQHHRAGHTRVVPVGHGGRDEPAGSAEFAVAVIIRRLGHRAALVATAFERPVAAIDTVIQAIGALHPIRDRDFADGARVCLEERHGRVRGMPFGRDADVIRLYFDKAHTHQPTQRIEGMRPTAEQRGLGRNRIDAPVVGGAFVDDVVVVVQVFAFAIEQRPQIPRPQEPMDVVQTGGIAHLIAHLVGQPGAFRQGNDALTFVDGQRHRDLAQDVLAGSQCHDGVLTVQMIRSGDDNGINRAVGQHRFDV